MLWLYYLIIGITAIIDIMILDSCKNNGHKICSTVCVTIMIVLVLLFV